MPAEETVADAAPDNWVDQYAPLSVRPYLRLMRADRPIGTWLLLWPCWWSLALATGSGSLPDPGFMILFALGAFLLRGAGCTLNDIIDKSFDAKVERTRARPLPSGTISLREAALFFLVLSLAGLIVLLQFNEFTVLLGLSSLGLVAVYPLMKRYTHWPQLVLGLTFNWGALMGWAAINQDLAWPALLLYAAGIFWTLGYDTIYALQDMEDDSLIGVKSTALLFGDSASRWIAGFYVVALLFFAGAGMAAETGTIYFLAVGAMAAQFIWQLRALEPGDTQSCLRVFKSNSYAGWILFLGIVVANQL